MNADDAVTAASGCKKKGQKLNSSWNPFYKSKHKTSSDVEIAIDPAELQRVSFATSIEELPERPSAFKQVLSQIGARKNQSAPLMLRKVQDNIKRLNKNSRSNSPQGRTSQHSLPASDHGEWSTSTNNMNVVQPKMSNFHSPGNFDAQSNTSDDVTMAPHVGEEVFPTSAATTATQPPTYATPSAGSLLLDPSSAGSANNSVSDGISSTSPGVDVVVVDGFMSRSDDAAKLRHMVEQLQAKVLRTGEHIRVEQETRDENVAEYLRLAANADRQQASRIKTVFERKNQKSNANIAQLQRKCEAYNRKLREIELNGSRGQGRLRDVTSNIRDFSGGVVGSFKQATQNAAGAIVSKPKDLAFKLKNKFGSSDNIASLKDDDDADVRYGSADDASSTSESVDVVSVGAGSKLMSSLVSTTESADTTSHKLPFSPSDQLQIVATQLMTLKSDIEEIRHSQVTLADKFGELQKQTREETNELSNALQAERFRNERLEALMNNLSEFQERELGNLKQELSGVEEKFEYHLNERFRDMQESVERCQTRLSKIEIQQQQLQHGDNLEQVSARILFGKLINVVMSVLAVLLVFVSTISGLLRPLMYSTQRLMAAVLVGILAVVVYKHWDSISLHVLPTAS